MNEAGFFAEMARMAAENKVFLPGEGKLRALFGPDLGDSAKFINVVHGVDQEKATHVFVTTSHVTAARLGLIRSKQQWKVPLAEVIDVDVMQGGFRGYVSIDLVVKTTKRAHEARFAFKNPQTDPMGAQHLEVALHNATVAAREIDWVRSRSGTTQQEPDGGLATAEHADPALEEFHLAIAASQAEPTGDSGSTMTARQLARAAAIGRQLYADGNYAEVWQRRLALGYGVPRDVMTQRDRFWLDAEAALAALKIEKKAHPFVATCCGLAEQDADRSDPEQSAAVAEFNRLFFAS